MMSEQHIVGMHTKDLCCSYADWISAWTTHLPADVKVPPVATVVTSPLDVSRWKEALSDHPNKPLTYFFLSGVTQGFHIGFKQQLHPLKSAKRNLCCALQHPYTVEKCLAEEIALGKVAGPF